MGRTVGSKTPKLKCIGDCGRELALHRFYQSNSPLFPNGKAPLCKDCIKEQIDYDKIQTIYDILQALDLPFISETWYTTAAKSPKNILGNYIRQINSLPQYKSLGYKDSIFENAGLITKEVKSEIKATKTVKKDEPKRKLVYSTEWRGNYYQEDIDYLNSYYADLQADFKIVTRNHRDYARKIAKASLAMDRAYEDMLNGVQGSDGRYKNLKDTFDQLSKSAQFAEDKRGANDVGLGCFGVVFDLTEKHNWIYKHTPIEKDDIDKMIESFSTIEKSL